MQAMKSYMNSLRRIKEHETNKKKQKWLKEIKIRWAEGVICLDLVTFLVSFTGWIKLSIINSFCSIYTFLHIFPPPLSSPAFLLFLYFFLFFFGQLHAYIYINTVGLAHRIKDLGIADYVFIEQVSMGFCWAYYSTDICHVKNGAIMRFFLSILLRFSMAYL